MEYLHFKKQLNAFLIDTGTSKNALAKTLKISQSQVSNWANYGLKRWTKNTKKIDNFIQEYYQDNFKIPIEIEKLLKQILLKNSGNEAHILAILNSIKQL
ncbi:MAG: hypothetical protein Rsou_0377 [Candidatus Ruthia sp. Asou_11_S2]|nr:hypothetical protein [Candidatus Ruthia sp. Asou_11_S2]